MTNGYLIIDMETGLMDGWYQDIQWAKDALMSLDERHPGRDWVLMELIETPHGDGRPVVHDNMFHANKKSLLMVN